MTDDQLKNDTVELKVSCNLINKRNFKSLSLPRKQSITFMYDKYTKGKTVAMTLTSNEDGIDAPDHEIYFNHDDLKSILEFLLNQKK